MNADPAHYQYPKCGEEHGICAVCRPTAPAPSSAPFPLRSASEIIITEADTNLFLGSGELLPCPFCGSHPISSGEHIEGRAGKAVRWKIQCTGHAAGSIVPDCFASVIGVDPDQGQARADAVRRWNSRVPNAASEPRREGDNQTGTSNPGAGSTE